MSLFRLSLTRLDAPFRCTARNSFSSLFTSPASLAISQRTGWTNPLATHQLTVTETLKTHASLKKRFRTRANGTLKFKPAGRIHGMSKHSSSRNKGKGAGVIVAPGEAGAIWLRAKKLGVE